MTDPSCASQGSNPWAAILLGAVRRLGEGEVDAT